MNGTTMVVVIVCVVSGVLYKMYNSHLEYKSKTITHKDNADKQNELLINQLKTLSERVEILEKIVTDEGYQVKKDINNL